MLFIGVALLIAVGIALAISADAGSLVGLSQQQTGQLIPLVLILILVAGGAFSRRRRFAELFGGIALWIGIFGAVVVGYTYRDDILGVVGRVSGELRPGVAVIDAERGTATFRRGIGGHFQLNASINGHTVPVIFDTGASAVVLTASDAKAAGIDVDRLRYDVAVSTANGTGRAASVLLDEVDIGGIERKRVRAFVAEAGALETSLLGMTYLETLSRYAVTSNSLELVD
jgi:aspartyl protease family protein